MALARCFVDLGGGPAQYCCETVCCHPELAATLLDLPLTVEVARECIATAGLEARVRTIVCDFYACKAADLGDHEVIRTFVEQLVDAVRAMSAEARPSPSDASC